MCQGVSTQAWVPACLPVRSVIMPLSACLFLETIFKQVGRYMRTLRDAGDVLHPAWEIPKNETSMRALAPCQSLGAFYTKPSLATLQFYRYLSHWMIQTHPHQWDQAAWNEV